MGLGGYIVVDGNAGQHVFVLTIANPHPRSLIPQLSLSKSLLLLLLPPGPVRLPLPLPIQLLSTSFPKLQEIHPAAIKTTHKHFT